MPLNYICQLAIQNFIAIYREKNVLRINCCISITRPDNTKYIKTVTLNKARMINF